MSEQCRIKHFCGVKSLASKSGGIRIWAKAKAARPSRIVGQGYSQAGKFGHTQNCQPQDWLLVANREVGNPEGSLNFGA